MTQPPLVPADHRPESTEQLCACLGERAVLARDELGEGVEVLFERGEVAQGNFGFEDDAPNLGLEDGEGVGEGGTDDFVYGSAGGEGPKNGEAGARFGFVRFDGV